MGVRYTTRTFGKGRPPRPQSGDAILKSNFAVSPTQEKKRGGGFSPTSAADGMGASGNPDADSFSAGKREEEEEEEKQISDFRNG